jgi:hypothetical protein
VGDQAHLVKLAGSQEPSLRSIGATRARSVGGERKSRAIEPRKVIIAEAFVVTITGAAPMCRNGLTHRLDRGPRTGQMCGGSSRNLGEDGLGYHKKSPACGRERSQARRSEERWTQAINGIARVKETKRGEKAARRRSVLIVPVKQGNLT